jgi:hypothetical protein
MPVRFHQPSKSHVHQPSSRRPQTFHPRTRGLTIPLFINDACQLGGSWRTQCGSRRCARTTMRYVHMYIYIYNIYTYVYIYIYIYMCVYVGHSLQLSLVHTILHPSTLLRLWRYRWEVSTLMLNVKLRDVSMSTGPSAGCAGGPPSEHPVALPYRYTSCIDYIYIYIHIYTYIYYYIHNIYTYIYIYIYIYICLNIIYIHPSVSA